MAHALYGHAGGCGAIQGHSYELHVTAQGRAPQQEYLESAGLLIDFKNLKEIAFARIIHGMDHKPWLSGRYAREYGIPEDTGNLVLFEAEPSVENLLLYIRNHLAGAFAPEVTLKSLTRYETRDSYGRWEAGPE